MIDASLADLIVEIAQSDPGTFYLILSLYIVTLIMFVGISIVLAVQLGRIRHTVLNFRRIAVEKYGIFYTDLSKAPVFKLLVRQLESDLKWLK